MTIWRGKNPPVLASQSRARQTLLGNAGLVFEAVPADIDERAIQEKSGFVPGKAFFLCRVESYGVGEFGLRALSARLRLSRAISASLRCAS